MHLFSEAAHSENTLTVSYITDESGGQIAVVPLDKEVDQSKVYVISDGEGEHGDDVVEGDGEGEDNDKDKDDGLEEIEVEEGSDSDEDDGGSHGDDTDADADEEEEEEDDDDDDDDDDDEMDDDDDYIPKNQTKFTRKRATKSTDDEADSSDDKIASGHNTKKRGRQKKKLEIKEIVTVDADGVASKYFFFSAG